MAFLAKEMTCGYMELEKEKHTQYKIDKDRNSRTELPSIVAATQIWINKSSSNGG